MLKLRKILLSNYPYIILLILSVISLIIRINLYKNINIKRNTITGVINEYHIDSNKLDIIIKNKNKYKGTYYFKTKKEKNSFIKNYYLGTKIKVNGTISLSNSNYLKSKNIKDLITIKNINIINNKINIYYYLKNIIKKRLSNNPYLYTFILGDKYYINKKVLKSYQDNGISHLFAISGMHITLLSNIILNILKKLKLKEEKRYIYTNILLIIYLLLIGLSPSILRGVLFFTLFSINKIYYFYINKINIFITTLSICILINPFYIYDIGFIYSFVISLTLLITGEYINSFNSYIKKVLITSIISYIISIPITLYNYNQINILSIIYNVFYVPFISIIVFPLSLLTFIFPKLIIILNIFINILENSSLIFNKISITKYIFVDTNIFIIFIYYLIIIEVLRKLLTNKIKYIFLLFIILIIHYNIPNIIKTNYINYINVGQGDSIFIHLSNKNILIDTGGKKIYKNKNFKKQNNISSIIDQTTIPLLKKYGVNSINYLIISHGDYDHMGEAINLVNNFKVEKVIFNCGPYNDLEKELIKVLNKKKIKYYSCIKELNIDNNKLYFLQTKEYDNENDNSNVIYTEIDGYKFMFMGDASSTTEKEILSKYNLPNIDVLKVGHHGSKTSSGREFIDEINPKYSIISVGKNNRYGHPNKEVLNNLENSKIYRTDQDGSIMFKIKNNKLEIEICSP